MAKKINNWLDKFSEAQNGIEGTMGGLTDVGFDYNGAWGGPSMQMGGSLPGAVGFTYARTQSPAPSNGKYAKKTKASAQNGKQTKKAIIDPLTGKPAIGERLKLLLASQNPKDQGVIKPYDKVQHYINNAVRAADVTTDLMQLGNFIPNPIAQTIGRAGNWLGAGIDAYQTYNDLKEGDYTGAAINTASLAIPIGLESSLFKRNSKYLKPGQPLYPFSPQASGSFNRVKYIEPFTKVKGMTDNSLLANRALLGTLGTETVLDTKEDGGNIIAQNGEEMKFYQEGLDFTPKTISKDGSWLSKYQDGGNSPLHSKNKKNNNDITSNEYNKKHPPIYITNPNDSRIGFYTEEGNQYLYKKPTVKYKEREKPINIPSVKTSGVSNSSQLNSLSKTISSLEDPNRNLLATYDTGAHSGTAHFYPESIKALVNQNPNWKNYIDITNNESIYNSINNLSNSNDDFSKWNLYSSMVKGGLKYEDGGVIEDPMGQWAHPGEITRIPSNEITMQGVNYPVLGISDTGDTQMMYPNQDYSFDGESVTEVPMMQEGGPVEKTYGTYRLPEVVITGQAPEKGFWDQSISAFLNENKDAGLLGALSSVVTYPLGLPQQAMMYGMTGKVQQPSEALGITNPYGSFAVNTLADPSNVFGIGLADDALRLSNRAGKFLRQNTGDVGNLDLPQQMNSMNQFFSDMDRFIRLKETKNPQSLNVLNDFKTRIATPEGQQRMKNLGITREDLLQDLSIVEDPTSYGYYRPGMNKIAMHPDSPFPRKVTRHEIEHGVQNAFQKSKMDEAGKWYNNLPFFSNQNKRFQALEGNTQIDDLLSNIELRNEPDLTRVWKKDAQDIRRPIDISDYKQKILNRQNATDYFATGSEGSEKSAFLGEVQQYMMDQGILPKTGYKQVTPEMVKKLYVDRTFDEPGGGKYLRLFNIMKPSESNYKLISEGLNKMLTASPAIVGAGAIGSQINQPSQQQKNGGWLNKYE